MTSAIRSRVLKAVADGDTAALRALIAKDRKLLSAPVRDGDLLLHLAVRARQPAVVRELVEAGADVDAKAESDDESVPLGIAVRECLRDVVEFLLSRGADPHLEQGFNGDAMYTAIEGGKPCHLEMIDVLIRNGYDLDRGAVWTPLMAAVQKNRVDIAERLIAAGAGLNVVTCRGTALHVAVEKNRPPFVRLLLEHGADPGIRAPAEHPDWPGLSALEAARAARRSVLVELMRAGGRAASPAKARWAAYVEALTERHPAAAKGLRKPADPGTVHKLAEFVGAPLPVEFLDYLAHADGQDPRRPAVPSPASEVDLQYAFLPVREMMAHAKVQVAGLKDAQREARPVTANRQVRDSWWDPKWLPIAANGSGDFICLDFHPAPLGQVGQVIHTNQETGHRSFVAASFGQWLGELIRQM